MTTKTVTTANHRVVSREEWLQERINILAVEKELMRKHDELTAKIRNMPWVKVDQTYEFESTQGMVSLADLFEDKSQLFVYHFMFDPTWSQGCKSCSFIADHYNGIVVHLAHRDISFVTISRAPIDMIEPFRERMGWTFPWVSTGKSSFGRDYGVSFTDQELAEGKSTYNFNRKAYAIRELPGLSVFFKDDSGTIFHTYSAFARGLENFLTAYQYIDLTPKGRDEEQGGGMGWLRHHDRYDGSPFVHPWMERPGITGPAMH